MIKTRDIVFFFVVIDFLLGVIFYDFIDRRLGFSYTDEIVTSSLCIVYAFFLISKGYFRINKLFMIFIFIITGYLLYSFAIKSNTPAAIVSDFLVFIKSFLAFFILFELRPELTRHHLKAFKYLSIISSLYLLIIGLLGNEAIRFMFGHPTHFASSAIATALLFFYASSFSVRSIMVTILFLSVGLFSTRSKMYGFWILSTMLLIFFYPRIKRNTFKLSIKITVPLLVIAGMVLFFTWGKIDKYFIRGTKDIENIYARPALYIASYQIMKDYFPLGSGFGSFASYFSGAYYSKIYSKYGLDRTWGLTKDQPNYVADTFFPELLGQFGITGLILFVVFWIVINKDAYKQMRRTRRNARLFILILLITFFFFFESIAASSFVQNKGIFMMFLLALAASEIRMTRFKQDTGRVLKEVPRLP
jgi:O-antigen ligase